MSRSKSKLIDLFRSSSPLIFQLNIDEKDVLKVARYREHLDKRSYCNLEQRHPSKTRTAFLQNLKKNFIERCHAQRGVIRRRGCEAPSLMAAPVRTNTSESSDSSSTHNFWGGVCECKQTLCLSRRSHIHPKLSTRCRSIYF